MAKLSPAKQACFSDKIAANRREGKSQDQAVAIAASQCDIPQMSSHGSHGVEGQDKTTPFPFTLPK